MFFFLDCLQYCFSFYFGDALTPKEPHTYGLDLEFKEMENKIFEFELLTTHVDMMMDAGSSMLEVHDK